MALTVKHAKTDSITDWTQADLDAQIAAGNFPPGTTLANIVLPSDWNADHALTGVASPSQLGTGAIGNGELFLRDDGTWSNILISSASKAFEVGPNGTTNPAFTIDASLASANTGVKIIAGTSTGSNVTTVQMTSPSSSGSLYLQAKGTTGTVRLVGAGGIVFAPDGGNRAIFTSNTFTFTPNSKSGTTLASFTFKSSTKTTVQANQEFTEVYWNLNNTCGHQAGTIPLNRDFRISGSTHTGGGAVLIDVAATLSIDNTPQAGANVTITNPYAIHAPSGVSLFQSLATGIQVFTGAGAIAVDRTNSTIIVNKAVGAATAVNLPANAAPGQTFIIKDGKGDAAANNITITPPSGLIDGGASYVIATNKASVMLQFDGVNWWIL